MDYLLPGFAAIIVIAVLATLGKEGTWSNLILLLEIVFASIVAVNFFEPLGAWLGGQVKALTYFADFMCLWVLFAATFAGLRAITDYISRTQVRFHKMVDDAGSMVLAVAIAWLMLCFIMFTLHTAPLPREAWGFKPEAKMLFGLKPDRVWLGFMQQLSRGAYARNNEFDPKAEFIIKHASRRVEYATKADEG